ncbi:MAG TPA: signal recognition particle-docking protein FtsY [Thermotogaceae bacterium]|nr:signal recognition particle-docking protein FtsY [Thermotogota bacterium]HEW91074.1 signal recognition particle-docking protein FtsY [Thermotogaceae bacterium]
MGLFGKKFKKGLTKTRNSFFKRIFSILRGGKLSREDIEEIEELLVLADVSIETTEMLIEKLLEAKGDPLVELEKLLIEILSGDTSLHFADAPPTVISVVGVNGTGKTTTIGKLAYYLKNEYRKNVVLAAADTFRAAAIDQLKIWAQKAGTDFIAHQMGSDPAAVAYDAVNHAKATGKDVVIIDTAGRLHTKYNLMNELNKIHRVTKKIVPDSPHEVLLIVDATTGQNGLVQAQKFKEAVNITGLVITKLDGTAKGGIAITIREKLGIPIKFVGLGENIDDFEVFSAEDFVKSLFEEA